MVFPMSGILEEPLKHRIGDAIEVGALVTGILATPVQVSTKSMEYSVADSMECSMECSMAYSMKGSMAYSMFDVVRCWRDVLPISMEGAALQGGDDGGMSCLVVAFIDVL